MENQKIGIIIPAYNEEKRIGKTLLNYGNFFEDRRKKEKFNYEILVVINNTKDKTEEIVKEFQKKNKQIQFLNFRQGGKGFAITEGFKYFLEKSPEFIGFVDADCSTPPEAFYDLFLNIGNEDGIIANRWDKRSIIPNKQSLFRRIMSRTFNFIVRSVLFIKLRDTQCGAKIFRKCAIEKIIKELKVSEYAFDINLLYSLKKNNFHIKEIPTYWVDEKESKIESGKASLQMFLSVIRLRIIYSPFEKLSKPLKPLIKSLYNFTK